MTEKNLGIPGFGPGTRIGRGGTASVWASVRESDDLKVAIKLFPPAADEKSVQHEVDALRRLGDHPNIVPIIDSGTTADGNAFLVMPRMDSSLKESIELNGPFPWERACEIMILVAEIVGYAHSRNVLHRDIKPANILLDFHGATRISDFGIAKITDGTLGSSSALRATPVYTAPERLAGEPATNRSDVYAMAATLTALITGKPPFRQSGDESIFAVLRRIGEDAPPDVVIAGAPRRLQRVIERAMRKDANRRTASAAKFASALESVLASNRGVSGNEALSSPGRHMSGPRRGPRSARRSSTVTRSLMAAGVLAIVSQGVWISTGGSDDPLSDVVVVPADEGDEQASDTVVTNPQQEQEPTPSPTVATPTATSTPDASATAVPEESHTTPTPPDPGDASTSAVAGSEPTAEPTRQTLTPTPVPVAAQPDGDSAQRSQPADAPPTVLPTPRPTPTTVAPTSVPVPTVAAPTPTPVPVALPSCPSGFDGPTNGVCSRTVAALVTQPAAETFCTSGQLIDGQCLVTATRIAGDPVCEVGGGVAEIDGSCVTVVASAITPAACSAPYLAFGSLCRTNNSGVDQSSLLSFVCPSAPGTVTTNMHTTGGGITKVSSCEYDPGGEPTCDSGTLTTDQTQCLTGSAATTATSTCPAGFTESGNDCQRLDVPITETPDAVYSCPPGSTGTPWEFNAFCVETIAAS